MSSLLPGARERFVPAVAASVAAVVLWSFMGVVIKSIDLSGMEVAFWRLWLGALLMLVVVKIARRPFGSAELRRSALGGAVFAADVALFFTSLKLTTVTNATLIASLQPLVVMGVAGPLFGERSSRRQIGLTVVALGGVAMVVLGARDAPVWSPIGDFVAALALVAWSGYFLATKAARSTMGALEYMTGVMLWSAVLVTPVVVVTDGIPSAPDTGGWVLLAVLVGTNAIAHVWSSWSQRYLDVTLSSLLALGVPVGAAISALLLIDEPLFGLQIAGGVVTLIAMAGVVRSHGRTNTTPLDAPPATTPAAGEA